MMKLQAERGIPGENRLPQKKLQDPKLRLLLELTGAFAGGFCLSAAGLGGVPLPLCLAVLCAGLPGWQSMAFGLGGSLGYSVFWGLAGLQGLVWIAFSLPISVLLREDRRGLPLLSPCAGALIVAASGLVFQIWQDEGVSVILYLLRVVLAFGCTCLALGLRYHKGPMSQATAVGLLVLSLAQIAPLKMLNLGFLAAGYLALTAPFPMVTLTGLALDLAGVTSVPMTAVLCLSYFLGRISFLPRRGKVLLPPLVYLAVMGLCGQSQWLHLPPLALGGLASLLPAAAEERQMQTLESYVQARLETVSAVMAQSRRLLKEINGYPPDEGALILRAADQACGRCDKRKNCPAAERAKFLPRALLHQSDITAENLPSECKRQERLLEQLQHSQQWYRLLMADRQRQKEYRSALIQQYGFLADYLREMADELPHWEEEPVARFRPEVAACSRGREATNGDRCCWFAGTKGRYYILLCDGMGTGEGAAYEARLAAGMLRRMLCAGYSAHEAMQSLNSMCILRANAGAVTMDLAEADLMTGRVSLYKWGAAPSWLLNAAGVERIGRECPPPGISLEEGQETVDRVPLHHGGVLVMVSDGVDAHNALATPVEDLQQPAGFLAAMILENGLTEVPDDATAVVVRLHRV